MGGRRAGVALGFRRLAILDLSPQGHQPMRSPSGRFVAVFNGEVYNFAELRRELEAGGFRFRGRSDTEVILAAFERWGIEAAVRRFVGMFAIAVWDAERRELSLVRDRLGKKPLYVYSEPGLVTFGSELKALVAGPSFDRAIDRDGARVVSSLPVRAGAPDDLRARHQASRRPHPHDRRSGARRCRRRGRTGRSRDAARRGLANPILSEADAIDRARHGCCPTPSARGWCADVPLGALLSGGHRLVDGRRADAAVERRPVSTFTIGFDDAAFDEAAHAARVARASRHRPHGADDRRRATRSALIPRLPDDLRRAVRRSVAAADAASSRSSRAAHVTVALCGDGGDELFARLQPLRLRHARCCRASNRVPRRVRAWLAAGVDRSPSEQLNRFGGRARRARAQGRRR